MSNVLQPLFRIRKFREENASQEVGRKKRALQEAEHDLEQKRKELSEYIAWRINKEDELYSGVFNKWLKRRNLDDLKQYVATLRNQQVAMEKEVGEAEKRKVEAEEALDAAREVLRKAILDKKKIEEYLKVWKAEMLAEEERKAEKELEDFKKKDMENFEEEPDEFGN